MYKLQFLFKEDVSLRDTLSLIGFKPDRIPSRGLCSRDYESVVNNVSVMF